MFKTGYILTPKHDLVWFLGLPFLAVALALGFQAWLPYVAVASINLWITIPHHYAGWVRSYGMPDVWDRFKDRLIIGPIVIIGFTVMGLQFAPISLLLLVTAWDHQHSIMQQHGLARIYDFKAGAGLKHTRRYDLALHWVLYSYMFLNAPMFKFLWIRELHRMRVPLSVSFVDTLLMVSQIVLVGYVLVYLWHLWKTHEEGAIINPVKYAFIFASYFLWYFVAWNTNSILLHAVAHRLMHGVQYMVMVYSFMRKSQQKGTFRAGLWSKLTGPGHLRWFLMGGVVYAVLFQLVINRPLDEFGFGVVNFAPYPAIEEFGVPAMDYASGYALFSQMMIYAYGLMHYYLDSFMWKVTDKQTQKGL